MRPPRPKAHEPAGDHSQRDYEDLFEPHGCGNLTAGETRRLQYSEFERVLLRWPILSVKATWK